jgi:hypothetical protein
MTETHSIHVAFNSISMWELSPDNITESGSPIPVSGEQSKALDDFLIDRSLKLKYRKLAGVLLASSLFQLSNSPWIEQYLGPDTIFVPSPDRTQLHQWCPQVVCTLVPKDNTTLQNDVIAAFGVLILELMADRRAPWKDEDNDWLSGERSNHVRLARILRTWEDDVSANHREVAKVCLELESIVDSLDHRDIVPDHKSVAVIYKYILEPLFRDFATSFGNALHLLESTVGPWSSLAGPTSLSPSSTAKRVLFDDEETSNAAER